MAAGSPVALDTVRAILTTFNAGDWDLHPLLNRHIGPAVEAAWRTRIRAPAQSFVERYGAPASDPDISIIVPLYGRYDLAEYQLALFADDPDFAANELIYVIDDPTIFNEFRQLCPHLHAIYRVPFTLAFSGANLGFSGANNHAAAMARGRYFLLMNSDVFPKSSGFLSQMLEAYRTVPDTGLLGFQLLFEDGSLQHAGIEFRRNPAWAGMWINHHPRKGGSPAGLAGIEDVPAVTAACVLIEAALYRQLGGLSEDYIVGDFEDSDLCLKALKAGRRNRITHDIALYHVERQSQNKIGSNHWRTNLTLYNCWVHDQRWGSTIAEIVS